MNDTEREILEEAGALFPRVVTNADKLRRMTDRELANALAEMSDQCINCQADTLETCRECWFWQLQQPAEKGKAMPEIKVRCEVCGHLTRIPTVTNADRIRSMSDYELAEWLADILNHCDAKSPTADCLESCPLYKCCNDQPSDNIEDWLKSPAEKDGET